MFDPGEGVSQPSLIQTTPQSEVTVRVSSRLFLPLHGNHRIIPIHTVAFVNSPLFQFSRLDLFSLPILAVAHFVLILPFSTQTICVFVRCADGYGQGVWVFKSIGILVKEFTSQSSDPLYFGTLLKYSLSDESFFVFRKAI